MTEDLDLNPTQLTNRQLLFITDRTGYSLTQVEALLQRPDVAEVATHRDLMTIAAALMQPDNPEAAWEALLDEDVQVIVNFANGVNAGPPPAEEPAAPVEPAAPIAPV